jgi:valyl-tRNA synthetase
MLEKTYDPHAIEQKLYEQWEDGGSFKIGGRGNAQPYTIVIPPPNVTGSLHMGHALNNTLQDILIRHERMKGRDALWQPGMDHAGIATQMVVERMLEAEGTKRRDIGREAFIERVWTWKDESGGLISRQLRRLGASADWSRERFTMDDGLSEAVLKVFVDLYDQGLIYKDKRLVNWDPKLLTAISDLEVQQQEVKGHLWHFRYPIEGQEGRFIVVATTRPETMLGDTAVAVHPEDERYADLIGKHAILPLVGRRIVIVADDYADPEQGTGAVKITPAHDFNDFEVGRRHNLEMINVLDQEARINENAPEAYRGLDRFAAREKIVDDLDALGLLEKIEDHTHMVPFGDRGGVPIEPWLTEQWYADAATLAKPAIEAVEQGKTRFVPENWTKTYYEWMRNIQPWCISRQLWWGHQIPAWYGPDETIFVAHDEAAAAEKARAHYGKDVELRRDPDVLDTWFSSALWPFSTLGWPEKTPELERYYPTDVLVTGFDIIFFWVARMMMMGLHFMCEVPFHTVYIHALVRDEKGQKMSKSKGNIIDPLELIGEYGADALRFTLAALAAPGRDIKLSPQRVEGYRNFTTKLWNAARYCQMNGCVSDPAFDPATCKQTVNRWMVGEMARLRLRLDGALDTYRFNEAAQAAYQTAWNTFCDWYLEFTKPILSGEDQAAIDETRKATGWALDQLLLMLHPFMPFVTEELWQQLAPEGRESPLILAGWPGYGEEAVDAAASAEMDWVVRLISLIRGTRSEVNVPAGAKIVVLLKDLDAAASARLDRHRDLIMRLARLESIDATTEIPRGSIQDVIDGATLVLPLADVIDIAAETQRLKKEIGKLEGEIGGLEKKLANEKFIANAPEEVVEENRERLAGAVQSRDRLNEALARLQAL